MVCEALVKVCVVGIVRKVRVVSGLDRDVSAKDDSSKGLDINSELALWREDGNEVASIAVWIGTLSSVELLFCGFAKSVVVLENLGKDLADGGNFLFANHLSALKFVAFSLNNNLAG